MYSGTYHSYYNYADTYNSKYADTYIANMDYTLVNRRFVCNHNEYIHNDDIFNQCQNIE